MSPAELIARFTAPDPHWRFDAVAQLVALGPRALPALLEAAHNPDVATRVHAVQALGKLRDLRGLPAVLAALGETASNGAVAIAAERALVEWGAAAPAVTALALTGAPPARARAVRVLGGPPELMLRLLSDPLDTVRLQALEALAGCDRDQALLRIPALLEDPTDFVRWGAAEALVKLGSPLGRGVLTEALEHDETHDWAEELLEQLR